VAKPARTIVTSDRKTPTGGEPRTANDPSSSAPPVTGTAASSGDAGRLTRPVPERHVTAGQEQYGLGDRVVERLQQRAVEPEQAAESERHRDDPHVVDRGVGEQPLEVAPPDAGFRRRCLHGLRALPRRGAAAAGASGEFELAATAREHLIKRIPLGGRSA